MRRLLKASAGATLALLIVLVAGVATAHAAAAPAAWQAVDVTLILDESPPVLMVAATLPASATLPADVQLFAPMGAQPQWLGEIMGGDPSQDPSLESSVTKQGTSGVYSFRLWNSRTAQLEALLPNAVTTDSSGFRASVAWPAPQDAPEVRLSVRLPKNAKIVVAAEGATLVTDDPTANYYTRTFKDVKAGKPVSLLVTYSTQTDTGGTAGGSLRSTLVLLLVVGLALAILALGVVIARSRRGSASADDEDGGADEDDGNGSNGSGEATAGTEASEGDDEDATDDPETDEFHMVQASSGRRGLSPRAVMAVLIIGVMTVAGIAAAMNATAPKASAEGVTKQFAQGEACTMASIPLDLVSGADPTAEAERVFSAIQGVPGIMHATVSAAESRVDVGYCDSQVTEEQIRAALTQAGFQPGASADGAASGAVEASAAE